MKTLDTTQQYPNSLAYCAPGFKGYPPLKATKAVENVLHDVCEYFSVSMQELKEKTRKVSIVFPRHIAMYLIYYSTDMMLKDVGKIFNRDHTTTMHALKIVKESLLTKHENNRTESLKSFFYKYSYSTKTFTKSKIIL